MRKNTHITQHGTYNEYNNYGCRCRRCKHAAHVYQRHYRAKPCSVCGVQTWSQHVNGRTGMCHACWALSTRLPEEIRHGREGVYKTCRCDKCRAAAAAARKRRRHEGRVFTHNRSGYCNGCRCDICREAQRVWWQERKALKA